MELLDFDFGAGGFDLFLDLFRFFLGHAFLEGLRSAFDESLRFRETQTGDRGTNFLNDGDLVRAAINEDDVEAGLLFSGFRSGATCGRTGGNSDGSSGADAPLLFELLHEVGDFENGKTAQLVNEFSCICHGVLSLVSSRPEASGHLRIRSRESDEEPIFVFVFGCSQRGLLVALRNFSEVLTEFTEFGEWSEATQLLNS